MRGVYPFVERLGYVLNRLRSFVFPGGGKDSVLVYVGLHRGESFRRIFRNYGTCYGFEANPDLFAQLEKEFRRFSHVRLHNKAVADFDGEVDFNISSNDGASSSLGNFDDNWENFKSGQVRINRTIRVPCINLFNFLTAEGVEFIDDYVSDIQGMDLQVLRTLRPFIESGQIGSITCEVTKDERVNIYHDLPANNESGFAELLHDRYELVAKGWGELSDGCFDGVPEQWWEMDCRWRLKQAPGVYSGT